MRPKLKMTLLFTIGVLAESNIVYANETPEYTAQKNSAFNLEQHHVIARSMKQIYQDENGTWFLSKHRGRKGGCAVTYSSDLNQLTLFGPSEKSTGAFAFIGPLIPTPQHNKQLNIIMRTDKTETPSAATLVLSRKKGVLLVPVAMEQTAAHMDDAGTMEILLDGKTVYSSSISGGFKARDALVSCIKS
ncbi:hypothetical protein F889_02221 [Acinetobacter colistiniresistens]|uniref:Uncharacterized protein n=1 Tax=Acinetobacter colistiniresistens TaxID=280145 RepID=N9R4N4_9GAMM|nr:hypothetical protein [Acinetobacter colistiniresistens]ENX33560.1 hypothetical protein F889_02221 [Acinetobacter colistiniresistens]